MNEIETKRHIEQVLARFSKGNLRENGIALLNALGLHSERDVILEPNTFDGLAEVHKPIAQINREKAMIGEWSSVDILFQLTGDDIREMAQGRFVFDGAGRVDNQIIESYLFLVIGLNRSDYSRSKLADVSREINKFFAMPVMILFQHGSFLTLSIINRRLNKHEESKDVLEKVTLIKGINYAFPLRAHIEILFDLSFDQLQKDTRFHNFVDLHHAWQKALDTSELNKKFYREIANWYFWAVKKVEFPAGAGQDRETRNATSVIRLITRLIFVWFIKEKGLVPENLFDSQRLKELLKFNDPKASTYYKAILQNLFFATLNTEMGKDRRFRGKNKNPNGLDSHHGISTVYRYEDYFNDPTEALRLFENIPFLNGGLFECLDKREEKILVDGFSDDPRNQPVVPDEIFFGKDRDVDLNDVYGDTHHSREKVRGLIHIFNSYKFTIEENTPLEEEIALDPELLGKVFENLLAAFNPETGTTARKQTGSFYTPREIVNYMVDESLIASFETKLAQAVPVATNLEPRLRHLLAYNQEPHQFDESEAVYLITAIDAIKVLDPACGSGAFPMGVLHKLVFILSKLDEHNHRWKQRQIDRAAEIPDLSVRERVIEDIEQSFDENELDYGRKLYLIENCIYGVDIQPIAVQIAKLRFFISLVVDQKIDPKKPNLGIRPLPNLETKFVAANTLIGIDRPQQMMFRNPEIEVKEKRLKEVREAIFTARTPLTKRKYREEDQKLRKEIADLLKKDGWGSNAAAQLAGWDPFNQNGSAEFFDPEWMFGIINGFDVIIGNPPYLESRHPAFNDKLKIAYQESAKRRWNDDAKYITKGTDLLIYFFENSIFNISPKGCVVLITQNSWLDTEYGKKFQTFLLKHTKVRKIVDSDFRYFPSGEGPNINAVITLFIGKIPSNENIVTFARYHESFAQIAIPNLTLTNPINHNVVSVQRYGYSNPILNEIKWGILLSASKDILELINLLNHRARRLKDLTNAKFSYGQGLNLSKDYFVSREALSDLQIKENVAIPILTSPDGAVFDIRNTAQYILDKTKLSQQEIKRIRSRGINIFDPKSTSKTPPCLIMPRGIGRHYCAMSSIRCFSSSGVDIYDNGQTVDKEAIFNLWLFFNSSVAWLLREISGRKNLGGGMLKAEAVDLEAFPVYMDFRRFQDIKEIFSKIKTRQALSSINEIDTIEHRKIDEIVFDHLNIDNAFRSTIVATLKAKIQEREQKSTTTLKQSDSFIPSSPSKIEGNEYSDINDENNNIGLTEILDTIEEINNIQTDHSSTVGPSDYTLYKCNICGRLVTGFMKDDHAQEKHRGATVEWKKISG